MGTPGAAAFHGSRLSAYGGARGAQQLETGVSGTVDHLGEHRLSCFLMLFSVSIIILGSIVKTTYVLVAGG